MNWCKADKGDVYIIFGESSRSDGSNIHGVFTNEESAKEEAELLKQIRAEEFTIEVHGLWE